MGDLKAWVTEHAVSLVVILVMAYAIWYVLAHRKNLFYKE